MFFFVFINTLFLSFFSTPLTLFKMRFSIIASTLPLLSLASAAVIAPRAESGATVLSQIEALTKKTESINPSVKALTDFPDFNKIRAVTDGLSQFNTLLQGDIQAMGNAYNIKISEAGQKNVCASYKTFKNQLTQTLQLLIGEYMFKGKAEKMNEE